MADVKELNYCRCFSLLALLLHQSWMALQAVLQSFTPCSQQQVLVKSLILSSTFLSGYRPTDRAGYCLPCIHGGALLTYFSPSYV